MQGLEFDLIVYAPYRPLEGFINDMEVRLVKPFQGSCFIYVQENPHNLVSICFLMYVFCLILWLQPQLLVIKFGSVGFLPSKEWRITDAEGNDFILCRCVSFNMNSEVFSGRSAIFYVTLKSFG